PSGRRMRCSTCSASIARVKRVSSIRASSASPDAARSPSTSLLATMRRRFSLPSSHPCSGARIRTQHLGCRRPRAEAALDGAHTYAPQRLPVNILTVNLLLSTLIFWIAARIYVLPKLRELPARVILLPILMLHAFRHLALMFLARGATFAGMPLQFAYPAAFGDLLASVLAIVAIPAVAMQARGSVRTCRQRARPPAVDGNAIDYERHL